VSHSSSATGSAPATSASLRASDSKHRADIDGLRSVAVLSVLFFHVGYSTFSGGWVGVDVFFVISGFLITRLIRDEIDAGSFSFAKFYTRRARRLFPAFIVTVTSSFVAGCVIFDPVYLQRFAGEVLYTLVGISNIFFWREGGYFAVAADYKPLLHTWSLGIEEQFYLLWPLAMVLTFRYLRRYAWLPLTLALVVSLFTADHEFYVGNENAVFFLLPSRVFEFAIGAMFVWLVERRSPRNFVRELALLLGLGMVLVAAVGFTPATPFPSLYALLPCVGAGLAMFGGSAKYAGRILTNAPMVAIGKISYSLYLVHWPIIVFYKYHRLEPLTPFEQASICAVSIALAAAMFLLVEQPVRTRAQTKALSRSEFGLRCASIAIALMVPAAVVWAKGGLLWRGSGVEISPVQIEQVEERRKELQVDEAMRKSSFSSNGDVPRLLFVGDSHSGDIAAALFLTLGADRFQYARLGFDDPCFSSTDTRHWSLRVVGTQSSCEAQLELLKRSPAVADASYIFIANYWSEDTIKGFDQGVSILKGLTKAQIVVVGQNAVFPTFDASLRYLSAGELARLNNLLFAQRSAVDLRINEELRRLAAANGLAFIDRESLVCSNRAASCQVVASSGKLLYTDRSHWSFEGLRIFGAMMVDKYGQIFQAAPR
jgi:peptidoglycan/LPS O-acetylase OafA/YrhL